MRHVRSTTRSPAHQRGASRRSRHFDRRPHEPELLHRPLGQHHQVPPARPRGGGCAPVTRTGGIGSITPGPDRRNHPFVGRRFTRAKGLPRIGVRLVGAAVRLVRIRHARRRITYSRLWPTTNPFEEIEGLCWRIDALSTSSKGADEVSEGSPNRLVPTRGSGVVVGRAEAFYRLIWNGLGLALKRLAYIFLKRIGHRVSPLSCGCRPIPAGVGTFGVTHCADSDAVGLPPRVTSSILPNGCEGERLLERTPGSR